MNALEGLAGSSRPIPSPQLGAVPEPGAELGAGSGPARAAPPGRSEVERLDAACPAPGPTSWPRIASAAASMSAADRAWSPGRPMNTATLARTAEHPSGRQRVEPCFRPPRRADSSASWAAPAARAASAAADQPGVLAASAAGVSAEAWASTLAREVKPPRFRPGRRPVSSRSATAASVPRVALAACQASSSTMPRSAAAAARARMDPSSLAPGAAPYTADRTKRVTEADGHAELDEAGRLRLVAGRAVHSSSARPAALIRSRLPVESAAATSSQQLRRRSGARAPAAGSAPRGGGPTGIGSSARPASLSRRTLQLVGQVDECQRVAAGGARRSAPRPPGRWVSGREDTSRRIAASGRDRRRCSAGTPAIWVLDVRRHRGSAKTRAADSASRRRATKASASSDSESRR